MLSAVSSQYPDRALMLNDRVLVYIAAFSKTSSYQVFFLYNFQLCFYLVTSCIALICTTCDNHL